jgi:hypothetical protein
MGLAELRPEWLGANIVVSGLPDFSLTPPRTLLFFEGGVTLKVDGQNAPCRSAGKAVAAGAGLDNADEVAMQFVKAAKRLRGLVAWIEKPGTIAAGAKFEARLPEQWLYRASPFLRDNVRVLGRGEIEKEWLCGTIGIDDL